jgi:hypothetical protein
MSTIQDIADLFVKIADELEKGTEEEGAEIMLALDSKAYRKMADIIQGELESRDQSPAMTGARLN